MTDSRSFRALAILHAALGLGALIAAGPKAFVLLFVLGGLALLRYAAMARASRSLGGPILPLMLFWSLWLVALVALGLALFIVGSRAPSLLPWGAAAALLGPLMVSFGTMVTGLRALARRHKEATA